MNQSRRASAAPTTRWPPSQRRKGAANAGAGREARRTRSQDRENRGETKPPAGRIGKEPQGGGTDPRERCAAQHRHAEKRGRTPRRAGDTRVPATGRRTRPERRSGNAEQNADSREPTTGTASSGTAPEERGNQGAGGGATREGSGDHSSSYGTSAGRETAAGEPRGVTQRSSRAPSERGPRAGTRRLRGMGGSGRTQPLITKHANMRRRGRQTDREGLAEEPRAAHRELGREPVDIPQLTAGKTNLDDPIERLQIRIVERGSRRHDRQRADTGNRTSKSGRIMSSSDDQSGGSCGFTAAVDKAPEGCVSGIELTTSSTTSSISVTGTRRTFAWAVSSTRSSAGDFGPAI